jgi:hypothetical protein
MCLYVCLLDHSKQVYAMSIMQKESCHTHEAIDFLFVEIFISLLFGKHGNDRLRLATAA